MKVVLWYWPWLEDIMPPHLLVVFAVRLAGTYSGNKALYCLSKRETNHCAVTCSNRITLFQLALSTTLSWKCPRCPHTFLTKKQGSTIEDLRHMLQHAYYQNSWAVMYVFQDTFFNQKGNCFTATYFISPLFDQIPLWSVRSYSLLNPQFVDHGWQEDLTTQHCK